MRKTYFSKFSVLVPLAIAMTGTEAYSQPAPPQALVFTKAFGAPTIPLNGTTNLVLSINNPNPNGGGPNPAFPIGTVTVVTFTDTLPAGAVPSGPVTFASCSGAGATIVGQVVTLTSATIQPGATCTVTVPVITGTTAGTKVNNAGPITTAIMIAGIDPVVFAPVPASGTATATLIVVAPPTISKAFGVPAVALNGVTTLTLTIANSNSVALTGVAVSDTFPAGLTFSGLTTTCGGILVATTGPPAAFSLTGGTIPPNATCTLNANVMGTAPGALVNTTGNVSSANGGTDGTATATLTVTTDFYIRYAANLTSGDSVINLTNTGANGASLNGPGFGGAVGNICMNVYAFSPDEQLVSCCSCLVTPNGLVSLSVNNDLISNTLTGVRPNSIVVKVLPSAASPTFAGTSCTNSAALAGAATNPLLLPGGSLGFGTTVHALGAGFGTTETPFRGATLSQAELASITNRCTNIIGNGSTFGICRSCRTGGLSASR